mmetsp:Transcript_10393/g.42269  ORF Transcript_10393/g.42269 Transcript_10393/m.42269 type:complete len:439 (-) Transcript_10393:908-2224(-)
MRTTDTGTTAGSKRRREPQQQLHEPTAVTFPESKRVALADVTNQSQPQQTWPETVKADHEQVVPSSGDSLALTHDAEDELSSGLHPSSSVSSISSASSASSVGEVETKQASSREQPQQRLYRPAAAQIRRGRTRRFIDIDARSTDPAECATYCKDIFRNLFSQEKSFDKNYMSDVQTDISDTMRAILVDWLVEVVAEYALSIESLFLARVIIDRVLAVEPLERCKLQLLGIAALLIASKFEDIHAPAINEFVFISENSYTRSAIIAMETHVLNVLEFNLTIPTEMQFLPRLLKAATFELKNPVLEDKVTIMAHFFCELSLLQYDFIFYRPSTIALSAVCLALSAMGRDPWDQTLEHYSGHSYSEPEFRACIKRLHEVYVHPPVPQLRAVRGKYESPNFHSVATLPPGPMPTFPAQRPSHGLRMSRQQQLELSAAILVA